MEYRGFRNTEQLREYFVHAAIGAEHRDYVVTISQAAFNERRVGFQDGPDICFQRVLRELSGGIHAAGSLLAISDTELASYRAAHTPIARGRKPAPPAPAAEPGAPTADASSDGPTSAAKE